MEMPELSITINGREINFFPYLAGLTVLLALLKLIGWISIGWLAVFAPLWFVLVIFAVIFVYFALFVGGKFTITNFITGKKSKFDL